MCVYTHLMNGTRDVTNVEPRIWLLFQELICCIPIETLYLDLVTLGHDHLRNLLGVDIALLMAINANSYSLSLPIQI